MDEGPDHLIAWVRAGDAAALASYPGRLATAVGDLVASGTEPMRTSRFIADGNDAVTGRLLQLAEAELGPSPVPYSWLVLGSGGRQEQGLVTDQDNALVYDPTGDPTAAAYFTALAERVVAGLHSAGVPFCPGGYMATNWHRSLPEWRHTFGEWVDRPTPAGLVEAEVFLDFRPVHGSLATDALDDILRRGADRPRFQLLMARAAVTFEPALRFGRVRVKDHAVDLKRGGLAATVLLARLYALAAGSLERPTLRRLAAAAAAGTLSEAGAKGLAEAYDLLIALRLGAQLRQVAAGQPPDNRVRLEDLSAHESERLRHALHAIREVQQATALHFHTDAVS